MASVHKKGGSGGQTNFEIRLRIMFSYKDFISSMKPGICVAGGGRNEGAAIGGGLFVDAVDCICCLARTSRMRLRFVSSVRP